jgi:tetratricopeptide (TPR) repeat protein
MSLRIAILCIVALGCLTYSNSFDNSFHYDDEHSILENPNIRSLANIPRFFVDAGAFSGLDEARMYRPLLLVTLALNYAFGEYEPFGYHLVNLLFHLFNSVLLWLLAVRLGARSREALLVALIFVVHPLATEPVNYISSRSTLLAASCVLCGMVLLVRPHSRDFPWAASICVCYLGGLASKAVVASFPVVVATCLWVRGRLRHWYLPAALLVITVAYVAGTRAIISKAVFEPVRSLGVQAATQTKAFVFYIWTVFMPVRQSVEPQFSVATSWLDAPVVIALMFGVTLLLAAFRMALRHRMMLPTIWFFAALLPSSLIPLNVLVNEHRLYLSLAGFALILGVLFSMSAPRLRRILTLVLPLLIAMSFERNTVWVDGETLWGDAVAKGPRMSRPHVNLGKAYIQKGLFAEAIAESRRALDINPGLPRAYYNVGWAHHRQEELDLAAVHYKRAIELQPELIEAYNNLGNVYQEQGRPDRAFATYRRALEIRPVRQIYHNLGNAFLRHGEPDSARIAFEKAIRLDPDRQGSKESYKGLVKALRNGEHHETALATLSKAQSLWPQERPFKVLEGSVRAAQGDDAAATRVLIAAGLDTVEVQLSLGDEARKRSDWERALRHYDFALNAGSRDARVYNARGEALFAIGNLTGALEDFRTAARTDPELAAAYTNIGRVQLSRGRTVEAAAALKRTLDFDQDNPRVFALLGKAFALSGKTGEAMEAYRQAIALEPDTPELYSNMGLLYSQVGDKQRAEELYRKALAVESAHVPSLYHLGTLFLQQAKHAAAVDLLQEAVGLDDRHENAYMNLGAAHIQVGNQREAVRALERFLALHGIEDELGRKIEMQLLTLTTSEKAE